MDKKEFIEAYRQIAKKAVEYHEKCKREGSLSLEGMIDEEKFKERDIFELGLRFIVDGTESGLINKILSNIIDQEKDEYVKLLKIIQKEAVVAIGEGINSYLFIHLINSYTNLTLNEDEIFKPEYF